MCLKLKKEFSSEVDSAIAAFRGISVDSSAGHADLTHLFRVANHEAKKSRAQNRILRVVSISVRFSFVHTSCVAYNVQVYYIILTCNSSQKFIIIAVYIIHD